MEVHRKVAESGAAARIRAQAEVLAAARHPGVVELVGVEGSSDRPVLVTVLVNGPTLATPLVLTVAEVAGLAGALAATLADLHELGIVHGAVLPEHVLLGTDGRPVLCGFGASGRIGEPGPVGDHELDPAADVAGLGRLLRRLAIGPEARPLRRIAEAATSDDPTARPSAEEVAAQLAAAVPGARLPRLQAGSANGGVRVHDLRSLVAGARSDRRRSGFRRRRSGPPAGSSTTGDGIRPRPLTGDEPRDLPGRFGGHQRRGAGSMAGGSLLGTYDLGDRVVFEDAVDDGYSRGDDDAGARVDGARSGDAPEQGNHIDASHHGTSPGTLVADGPGRAAPHLRLRSRPATTSRRRLPVRSAALAGALGAVVAVGLLVVAPWASAGRSHDREVSAPIPDPSTGPSSRPFTVTTTIAPTTSTSAVVRGDCATPTSVLVADVDGDGCLDAVHYADGVLEAAGLRWSLGKPGDQLATGDWSCRGTRTVILLRPSTGEVFRFEAWAVGPHDSVAGAAVARVPGGQAVRAADVDRDGCHELVVERGELPPQVVRLPRSQP